MIAYFATCQDLESAKKLYRALAMQHHPDRGGDTATMQEINRQYADFQARYANRAERQRQQTAHDEGKRTTADYHDIDEVTANLARIIAALLNLGLTAELTGLWIWVSGDTKPHKEQLKALGLRWSPIKKLWYFAGVPTFNRKTRTMDEIRRKYGSQLYTRQEEEA